MGFFDFIKFGYAEVMARGQPQTKRTGNAHQTHTSPT